ncbi:DNA gyrase inhibitor YacG [Nitrospira moscoviensis]|uniref:DNA gyrase inhibitor YacG n=1 Tax=Nitrospira moscoviensis TaxID=42253 RepID=A0A0K2GI93_NITMO|nr:DNA gyrase inhibitor YacG [Nitrospira moscoviensis]ALA60688.1 DNA gyrase inhibitor YacG [Nitrospira moscoviensis]
MQCPVCRRSTTWTDNPWRPFCCERCQLIDLGTWAAEGYRIPGSSLTADASPRQADKEEQSDDAPSER